MFFRSLAATTFALSLQLSIAKDAPKEALPKPAHGLAYYNDLALPANFAHFPYINPNAPKGGALRLGTIGTFNSVNPFTLKDAAPAMVRTLTFDTLMKRSGDEPFSAYGLVAERALMALDRSTITFYLNKKARFHDGVPLTARDVAFTFNLLKEKGNAGFRMYAKKVAGLTIVNDHTITFTFVTEKDGTYDREVPIVLSFLSILPEHYLKDKDFEKLGMTPIVGSGAYKLTKADAGRALTFERVPDYWAKDLPVMVGFNNFDTIKMDFYGNQTVALEAFFAGEYDALEETNISRWKNSFKGKAVDAGNIKLVASPHTHQVGMKGFAFNTRKDIFSDVRVREAITLAFDFNWVNKNLYHDELTRTKSFFDNTEMASSDVPKGDALALLKSIDGVPDAIFAKPFALQSADTQSAMRAHIKKAQELLAQAGWTLKSGKLIHSVTQKPFTFEILLNSPEYEKVALALCRNLQPLGIKATVRVVDTAQYEMRRNNNDFDMLFHFWGHSMSPGIEQSFYWSSDAADTPGTHNYPGVKSPALDKLCSLLVQATSRKQQVTCVQAIDFVLLNGSYVIPFGHLNNDYIAYWTRIAMPPMDPKMGIPNWLTWWRNDVK